MEAKKITFKERLNNYINYYESMLDLLKSIKNPTEEEKIKIKIYEALVEDNKNLKKHYNYENKCNY